MRCHDRRRRAAWRAFPDRFRILPGAPPPAAEPPQFEPTRLSPMSSPRGPSAQRLASSLRYAADWRGETRSAISGPFSISARRSSQVFCRFSHRFGVVPKYRASRSAVSAVIPRWPFRIVVTRLTGTPSAFASALADSPSSSSPLAGFRPDAPASFRFSRSFHYPSMVVNDLHIARSIFRPAEADASLPIGPDTALARAVAT